MRILDSRRLTGPSLLLDAPGAILEIALDGADPERAIREWRSRLAALLGALGWADAAVAARAHAGGLSLAFSAPADTLYAATEVNEAAWHAASRALGGPAPEEGDESPEEVLTRLRAAVETERKPWLLALGREAARRGITLLSDDKRVSVGLGRGSRAWPLEESEGLLDRIPWAEVSDVPAALVTGTNGKTTSVRLLGAIAGAAGLVAGVTSTDRVTVGDEVVATGDYSGPNGARTVLRDRRVQLALLEVARGGILRRGLALPHARAALVTNVANDHLGEYGIFDLDALADVKLVVAKAVARGGAVVLNADDPRLAERGRRLATPVIWFSLNDDHPLLREHLANRGRACLLAGERLVYAAGGERRTITTVAALPIALGGAARYNVANALGVIGVAAALGLPEAAIRAGLEGFGGDAGSNPGRANVWRLSGVTVIVDFAHNPHGLTALAQTAAALPATRRGLVIGQAGDRDDEAIRELARAAWAMGPQHVFLKEMESFLRGREPGAVTSVLEAELRRCGAPAAALSHWPGEIEAVRAALAWARAGDLLVLTTHAQRGEVIALMDRLAAAGWAPGREIPGPVVA
ncbi:MAG: Mur ligase [Candidatus Eisenbacteria bacterium]|nr:Mur ligase [Candidatus Eisenbacteria bacterium]